MAYVDLSNDAMFAITAPWVERDGAARKRIEKYRVLGALLELVEPAHEAIASFQARAKTNPGSKRLEELTAEATAQDALHDEAVRGAVALLEAAELLAPDPAYAARMADTRVELFPDGRSLTNSSYTVEAGVALATEKKLAEQAILAKRLTRVKLVLETARGANTTITLAELVQKQIDAGKKLAAIEQERRSLEGSAPLLSKKKRTHSEVSNLRTAWIRAVSLFVNTANELPDFSADDRAAVFGPLAKALAEVERSPAATEEEGTEQDTPNQ